MKAKKQQRGRKPLSPWFSAYADTPAGGPGVYELKPLHRPVMRARFDGAQWWGLAGSLLLVLPGDLFRGVRGPQ